MIRIPRADMTDADAIHEFRWRLLAGRYGDRELLMPADRDYAGLWSALVDHLPRWEDRFGFDHPVVVEVRGAIQRLADARPDAVKLFALNTTRYGEEDQFARAA